MLFGAYSQLTSLRKECSAALQVVVDVALGRWVKLLAARSTAHTRLRQYELRQLLDLSEQVGRGAVHPASVCIAVFPP